MSSKENFNNGWISVKERMPEPDQNVLVMSDTGGISLATWTNDGWDSELILCDNRWINMYFDYSHIEAHKDDIVYWMPLPKPPKHEG